MTAIVATARGGTTSTHTTSTTKAHQQQAKGNVLRLKSAEYARNAYDKTFAKSTIQDKTNEYPHFEWGEIKLGKVLGKGGFGTVYECLAFDVSGDDATLQKNRITNTAISKSSTGGGTFAQSGRGMMRRLSSKFVPSAMEEDDTSEYEDLAGAMESRKFISEHCIRHTTGDARYAVKILSSEVVKDPALYIQGIIDMAVESRFLSNVEHTNIVKMRAVARSDPFEDDGYFIVMDRLYDTLEKRLAKWLVRYNRCTGMAGKLTDRKGSKKNELLEERLVYAFDLSAAIEHLHDHNIIYRDLKPENIGFDIRDDIKLFDFGLAKELRPHARNPDGTYNLTGMTGSMRYMAPEVANEQPYNKTCDVYSFAILLWEIMALKTPYEMYTPMSLRSKVYNGDHKRPPIDNTWSNAIKICLKRSWDKDIHDRNTMKQVTLSLRKECVRIRDGDDTGLEHMRRRSTHVFRRPTKAKASEPAPRRASELGNTEDPASTPLEVFAEGGSEEEEEDDTANPAEEQPGFTERVSESDDSEEENEGLFEA